MIWYITNHSVSKNHAFSTSLDNISNSNNDVSIFIDGYIIPRIQIFEEYKNSSRESMVRALYRKFGFDFIHYIKGVFVLIIFENNKFLIFNDRHSIKKYFIYEKNKKIFISNSLKTISNNFSLSLDKENIAVFSLISHFINGCTLFKNVTACRPAEIIIFDSGQLRRSFYWHPKDILQNRQIEKKKVSEYALYWKRIISSYISYLNPKNISLTLTGGNDSRMVLAALLSLNSKFHTFSFGNPLSYDCVISKKISENFNFTHNNYFVQKLTHEWFQTHANDAIHFGNSLVNIHRAHRNDAIVREITNYPGTEMLFTGLVGGEYVKEPAYNNIVIPFLFKTLSMLEHEAEALKLLENMLQEKGIQISNIDTRIILKKIQEFLAQGDGLSKAEKKFVYTYLFYGCSHHTQDSNVFGNQIKYVVNPFMDIDFLEMIAGYEKWYINRTHSFFSKAFHSEFIVGITDHLSPELSDIPYAKKGKYSANDLLRNKIKYIFKRLIYFITKDRDQYPPNFPISSWLYRFCDIELTRLGNELLEIYNTKILKRELEKVKDKTNEESWHIVTNPINVNLNYEYFKNH